MAAKKGRGVEVGVGYVSIVPSARGFAAQLKRDLNPNKLGREIGRDLDRGIEQGIGKDPVGKRLAPSKDSVKSTRSQLDGMLGGLKTVAVGAAVAGGAAIAVGIEAFKAYSDQVEATTKAQQVFGDQFARVDAVALNAAKTMGISRATALDSVATFGNLFRAMGVAVEPATDMSLSLQQLAADLGSFNNVPTEDALMAIRSGLVGEVEPMRRFGSNLSAARIEAEALSLGLVKNRVVSSEVTSATVRMEKAQVAAAAALKKHGENSVEYRAAQAQVELAQSAIEKAMKGHKVTLDAAQKAQAAYSIIMKDTVIAQGDYGRTAENAANKTKTLAAAWEDTKARLGQALQPLGMTVLDAASGALEGLNTWWTEHGPTVLDGLGKIKTWFSDTFGPDPVQSFKNGVTAVQESLNGIFGEDKIANFMTGARLVNEFMDKTFGPDKVASFEDGAMKVTKGVDNLATALDNIFGEDKVASFEAGSIKVAGAVDAVGAALGRARQASVFEEGKEVQPGLPGHVDFNFLEWLGRMGNLFEFDEGGVVGGAVGSPQLIKAHGGETVLPTHRGNLAALRGITAGQLAPAATGGPLVGSLTVNGQTDPAGSAWAMRRELRRAAYYAGSAYT